MALCLEVIKDKKDKNFLEIDYFFIGTPKVDNQEIMKDLFKYSDLFSGLVRDKYPDLNYLISPTLTRLEDQTMFFNKLYKFCYLCGLIDGSGKNLRIKNPDYIVIQGLIQRLREKKISYSYSRREYLLKTQEKIIRFYLRITFNFFREPLLFLLSKALIKPPELKAYDYALISFYDWRCDKQGSYSDHYFSPLIDYLIKQGKKTLFIDSLLDKNNPGASFRYIRNISRLKGQPEVKLSYQFICLWDIFRAFIAGFSSIPKIDKRIFFKGIDITSLIRLSLKDDFYHCNWFFTLIQYAMFKKLLAGFSFREIIYPFENHPWEKLLVVARDNAKNKPRLVAFQHSSFSFKQINNFSGKFEKGLPIFPEKIFTVGKIIKQLLEKQGNFPQGVLEEGCALRHSHLFSLKIENQKNSASRYGLVYAFSFDPNTYGQILGLLTSAFRGTRYTVFLKPHPLAIRRVRLSENLPENFILADKISWQEIFASVDMLFYDDNSLCIDALRHDVEPVFFPFLNHVYNSERFFDYVLQRVKISSPESIKEAVDDYFKQRALYQGQERKKYNHDYFYDYFTPVTEERLERFIL